MAAQSRASFTSGTLEGATTADATRSANLEEHFGARGRAARALRRGLAAGAAGGLDVRRERRLTRALLLLDHRPEHGLDADVIEVP
jgi:hypothetical protein